jgi:predicted nucleic acid-binding protein
MIVVADAGPLHYLVLIGAVDVLQPLYGRVLVPEAVAGELQNTNTPAIVQSWITHTPDWCEIRPDPPLDPALRSLDAGEPGSRIQIASSCWSGFDGAWEDGIYRLRTTTVASRMPLSAKSQC